MGENRCNLGYNGQPLRANRTGRTLGGGELPGDGTARTLRNVLKTSGKPSDAPNIPTGFSTTSTEAARIAMPKSEPVAEAAYVLPPNITPIHEYLYRVLTEKRPPVLPPEGSPRREAAKQWGDAAAYEVEYPAGIAIDRNNNVLHPYEKGRILLMDPHNPKAERPSRADEQGWEQVMADDEDPWCQATVDSMFEGNIERTLGVNSERPLVVVERGFGQGIMSRKIKNKLAAIGHGIHIIHELNHNRAEVAREWADKWNEEYKTEGTRVRIVVIEGDAVELTKELPTGSVDLFFSDTYPITKEEEGVNDIEDASEISRVMHDQGRLTFFLYKKGTNGRVTREQDALLDKNGFNYSYKHAAQVKPSNEYQYLWNDETGEPIDYLQVIVAEKDKNKLADKRARELKNGQPVDLKPAA